MWYIILGIVAVIVVVGLVFAPKKRNIPEKYKKAKGFLEEGNISEAIALLPEILIFPIRGKYSSEDAKQHILSIRLLESICEEQGMDQSSIFAPALTAFNRIYQDGGTVDSDLTDPIEELVEKMTKSAESQATLLLNAAREGNALDNKDAQDEDFTDLITSQEEQSIVNSIGKYLLTRNYQEGLSFIEKHLPSEMNPFKACLLDQKAAILFMNGDLEGASAIYKELLDFSPKNCRILTSLAESLVEMRRGHEAIEYAKQVTYYSKDRNLIRTAEKIVKKFA